MRVPRGSKTSGTTTSPEQTLKTDTIIVRALGKEYAEILKQVRQAVVPEPQGIKVKSVRKTTKGDLAITIKKYGSKANELQNELEKNRGCPNDISDKK